MSVSPKELSDHLLARAKHRLLRIEERTARARQAAVIAAEWLTERFGAHSVYLFGSLATGHAHELSDIDLAVEGLSAEFLPSARAKLEELTRPFQVDVVPWESLSESFRARIQERGIRLT